MVRQKVGLPEPGANCDRAELDRKRAGYPVLEELEQAGEMAAVLGPLAQVDAAQLCPRVLSNARTHVQATRRIHHLIRYLQKILVDFFGGFSVLAAHVAHFVFLRDVRIRTQRAAVASRRANNLAFSLNYKISQAF
jgi:hypothetical protein